MSADGQGAERAAPSPAGTSAAGPGEHQVEQPAPDTGTRGQTLAASSSRLSGIHMGSDGVIRITPEFVQAMSGGTAALLPEQATSNRSRSSLRRGFFNTPAASSGSKSARRDVGGASTPQAQPLPGSGPAPGTSQWWSDRAAVLGLDGAPWKVAGNGELILDAPGNINAVVRLLASVANALPREAKAQVANALKAAAGSSSSAAPADSTSLLSPEARLLFGDKDLLESLGNAVDFQLGRAAPEEPERTPADQNQHDGSRNEADKDVFAGQGAQEDRKAGTTVPSSQPSSPCMDDVWDDRCMVCGMWCDDTQDHDEDTMWSYGCEQQGCTNVMCRLCLSPTEMSDADSQAWRCPSCRGAPLPPPHAGSERKGSNKMVCRRFRDQWETAGEGRTITFRSDVWEVAGWHFQLRVDCTKPRNERTARDAAAKPPKGRKVAKARDARDGSSRGKAQEDAKLKAYLYLVDSEGKDYKDGRKLLHVGGKFVFIFLHQEDTDDDNIRRKACAPGSLFTNLIKNSKDSTSWGWADVPVSTLLHDGFLTDAGDLEIVVEVEVVNDIIEQLSMDDEIKASVCGVLGLLGDQGAFMKTIREKRANLESSGHKFPTRRECWTGGCTVFSKRREALETLCTELYWDSSRRSVMQSLLESDGYLAVRLKVMVRWVDILIAAESAGQEWPVSSSDDIPLLLLVGRLAVDFGKTGCPMPPLDVARVESKHSASSLGSREAWRILRHFFWEARLPPALVLETSRDKQVEPFACLIDGTKERLSESQDSTSACDYGLLFEVLKTGTGDLLRSARTAVTHCFTAVLPTSSQPSKTEGEVLAVRLGRQLAEAAVSMEKLQTRSFSTAWLLVFMLDPRSLKTAWILITTRVREERKQLDLRRRQQESEQAMAELLQLLDKEKAAEQNQKAVDESRRAKKREKKQRQKQRKAEAEAEADAEQAKEDDDLAHANDDGDGEMLKESPVQPDTPPEVVAGRAAEKKSPKVIAPAGAPDNTAGSASAARPAVSVPSASPATREQGPAGVGAKVTEDPPPKTPPVRKSRPDGAPEAKRGDASGRQTATQRAGTREQSAASKQADGVAQQQASVAQEASRLDNPDTATSRKKRNPESPSKHAPGSSRAVSQVAASATNGSTSHAPSPDASSTSATQDNSSAAIARADPTPVKPRAERVPPQSTVDIPVATPGGGVQAQEADVRGQSDDRRMQAMVFDHLCALFPQAEATEMLPQVLEAVMSAAHRTGAPLAHVFSDRNVLHAYVVEAANEARARQTAQLHDLWATRQPPGASSLGGFSEPVDSRPPPHAVNLGQTSQEWFRPLDYGGPLAPSPHASGGLGGFPVANKAQHEAPNVPHATFGFDVRSSPAPASLSAGTLFPQDRPGDDWMARTAQAAVARALQGMHRRVAHGASTGLVPPPPRNPDLQAGAGLAFSPGAIEPHWMDYPVQGGLSEKYSGSDMPAAEQPGAR